MARKTTIELVDDLTGTAADETVTFGLDGVEFEIDLTTENADKLREVLTNYTDKSRRIGGRAKRGTSGKAATNDAAQVRIWARENGYDVPERGRIPSEIRDAYDAGVPADKADAKADNAEKPAESKNDSPKPSAIKSVKDFEKDSDKADAKPADNKASKTA